MNDLFRKSALPLILLSLAGCATQGKPPPTISLDEPVPGDGGRRRYRALDRG